MLIYFASISPIPAFSIFKGAALKISVSPIMTFAHFELRDTFKPSKATDDVAEEYPSIDGAVATIMALDRAIRCGVDTTESVYDERGILFI